MQRIFKKIFLSVAILILIGCASKTQVHVYAKYLQETEKEAVMVELEKLGFTVIPNDLEFPMNVTDSTLLYSPMISDVNSIDVVADGMNSLGLKIESVSPLVSGNHWYTKSSIALFLIPMKNDKNRTQKVDLVNSYQSVECDKGVSIELKETGEYQFFGMHWNKVDSLLSKGVWEYRQHPYIELRPMQGESAYRYYEIVKGIEEDNVSKIRTLRLVPLQSHQLAGDCIFMFGTRILPN
ncbi:hypothetical protein [Rheinheimera sp. MM224]|uniref:hypothetical protein n=1 Tax=Rheinheimera sp. MM224 TaxID=3019969 RepID=UPI0021F85EEE|nr:hypothetical protein [Rheinheimera sp. MM224]CAI3797645.1 hypothetical protein JAMGFMIE_01872 [Rheinheimera sp. MM224]